MKHPLQFEFERCLHGLDEVAGAASRLRYDALGATLRGLAKHLREDGEKDAAAGRPRLGDQLHVASVAIEGAAVAVERVWALCERNRQQPKETAQRD